MEAWTRSFSISRADMRQRLCGRPLLRLPVLWSMGMLCWSWAIATPAQIQPDTTLPQNSTVTDRGTIQVITGGTQAGNNLFHSFRDFSVPRNGTASFQRIPAGIANIMTRVTGSSISRIEGTIEALQRDGNLSSARFFLINPNGIVFGANATLNLGGSFLATTADRLLFEDGTSFFANGTQTSPLLSVSVPSGLQFGRNAGAIQNFSRANAIVDPETNALISGGLTVLSGNTLALLGNGLSLPGGALSVEAGQTAGRIELGSVGAGQVRLNAIGNGWRLDYGGVQQFRDIQLSQGANLNASGLAGGSIQLQGRQIGLTDASAILSTTQGNQNGSGLRIRADQLHLDRFSRLDTTTAASGNSGNITINTRQLILTAGGQINAETQSQGNGGNITIRATEQVEINGQDSKTAQGVLQRTAISSQVGSQEVTGQGGAIRITTPSLRLLQGGQISAVSFGQGDAGTILIRTNLLELRGILRDTQGEPILISDRIIPTGLFTGTRTQTIFGTNRQLSARAGNIVIDTDRLILRDGAVIKTTTEGSGNSGNLIIRATTSVEVQGLAGEGLSPSSILAASGSVPLVEPGIETTTAINATGQGGRLQIRTAALRVQNGGTIAVGSLNPRGVARGAGSLSIAADTVFLENQGRLLSETNSGNGGNIQLQADRFLSLQDNSTISTTAGRDQAGGDGGNLNVTADFIAASPAENSDIRADAFGGDGGRIDINTQRLLGIVPRSQDTPLSDITASSTFGLNGTIQINSLTIDPGQSLVELPAAPVDAPALIAQGCATQSSATSAGEFVISGQGGISSSFSNSALANVFWEDTRSPQIYSVAAGASTHAGSAQRSPELSSNLSFSIIEAQGWAIDSNGQVILSAAAPTVTPYSSWRSPGGCPGLG